MAEISKNEPSCHRSEQYTIFFSLAATRRVRPDCAEDRPSRAIHARWASPEDRDEHYSDGGALGLLSRYSAVERDDGRSQPYGGELKRRPSCYISNGSSDQINPRRRPVQNTVGRPSRVLRMRHTHFILARLSPACEVLLQPIGPENKTKSTATEKEPQNKYVDLSCSRDPGPT